MLDRFMEKLVQNASAYLPNIGMMSEARANELEIIKAKVRNSPQEVEEWFDGEIRKVRNLNMNDLVNKAKEQQATRAD